VATSAPNTGLFIYAKVPWGMIGDKFYVRISDAKVRTDEPAQFVKSEYFSIVTDGANR
jgi:hypothetical protein